MNIFTDTLIIVLNRNVEVVEREEIIRSLKVNKYIKDVKIGNVCNIKSYLAYEEAKQDYYKAISNFERME
jgi:hypothetical protein